MKKLIPLLLCPLLLFPDLSLSASAGEHAAPALLQAARDGNARNVKTLLAEGADVNVRDNRDLTALMEAVFWGLSEIVSLLIGAGANVNAKNKDGSTALLDAASWGTHRDCQCADRRRSGRKRKGHVWLDPADVCREERTQRYCQSAA